MKDYIKKLYVDGHDIPDIVKIVLCSEATVVEAVLELLLED